MDSKNIFISSQHRVTNFDWSDLIHVGLDHERANEEVYLVIGRHDSRLTTLNEALKKVSTLLKTTNVLICNMSFSKAMQFYKIGVMSYGQKRD
jgi:hypothetical protein